MSSYRFPPSVASYACGQLALITQRIEQHQQEFGGRLPQRILLHTASSEALNNDTYKRYGVPHGFNVGVEVAVCPCQDEFSPDWLKRADGVWEVL